MRSVKSKGNKTTEVAVRMFFVRNGISEWEMHPVDIPGKPDFWFPKRKLAIFIDGCFWHGCFCRTHLPIHNRKYWKNKIERNVERDERVNDKLDQQGVNVIRVWEHELKNNNKLEEIILSIKHHVPHHSLQFPTTN